MHVDSNTARTVHAAPPWLGCASLPATSSPSARVSSGREVDDRDRSNARLVLVGERQREAGGLLAALKTERASVAARGRQLETEAAPIQYVAAVFGVTDSEIGIRWLIILMVLCCDPLAIQLTAAASARRT
jgi:hypothetical protein